MKIAVLALCLIGIACPKAKAQTVSDVEAQAAAKRYWNLVLTQCGDSYFYEYDQGLDGIGRKTTQYKRISFPARTAIPGPIPLSEADRANGLSWDGRIVVTYGLNRTYSDGEWSRWEDGVRTEKQMKKYKGHWFVGSIEFDEDTVDIELLHKWACSEIPGTPEHGKQHDAMEMNLPPK
jgi:hypothetical protein